MLKRIIIKAFVTAISAVAKVKEIPLKKVAKSNH